MEAVLGAWGWAWGAPGGKRLLRFWATGACGRVICRYVITKNEGSLVITREPVEGSSFLQRLADLTPALLFRCSSPHQSRPLGGRNL